MIHLKIITDKEFRKLKKEYNKRIIKKYMKKHIGKEHKEEIKKDYKGFKKISKTYRHKGIKFLSKNIKFTYAYIHIQKLLGFK